MCVCVFERFAYVRVFFKRNFAFEIRSPSARNGKKYTCKCIIIPYIATTSIERKEGRNEKYEEKIRKIFMDATGFICSPSSHNIVIYRDGVYFVLQTNDAL